MPSLTDLLKPEYGIGLAAKETKEEKTRRYYTVLGRFICVFSSAENSMYMLLFHLLKVTRWKARALIGGQNMGGLCTTAKRIAPRCLGQTKLKALNILLIQLDVLNLFRNYLVHRSVDISENEIRSGNYMSARSSESIEEMVVEIGHVESAITDLHCIMYRIHHLITPRKMGKLAKDQKKLIFAPWRYKPLAQENMERRFLLETLRRQHQPQSSGQ